MNLVHFDGVVVSGPVAAHAGIGVFHKPTWDAKGAVASGSESI